MILGQWKKGVRLQLKAQSGGAGDCTDYYRPDDLELGLCIDNVSECVSKSEGGQSYRGLGIHTLRPGAFVCLRRR